MLNAYFAFGVPLFLLILYIIFALVRRNGKIPYLGFVLLLISTFMAAFSFQVLQEFWSKNTTVQLPYSPNWLWLPLIVGVVLAFLNAWRGVKRFETFRSDRKN